MLRKYTIHSRIDRKGHRYWLVFPSAPDSQCIGVYDTWPDAIYYVCAFQGRRYHAA